MSAGAAPLVSIGMPAYNGSKHIASAIESLLAQTLADFELNIVDNASTDSTAAICEDYARRDARVRLIRNPVNIGVNLNYTVAARAARGRYFKWASTNDLCDRDMLASCAAVLEARSDVVLCAPQTRLFTTDPSQGEIYADALDLQEDDPAARFRLVIERLRLTNIMNGLIRNSVLRRTKYVRDYGLSDKLLIAELALRGKIVMLPEVLLMRRMDAESATRLKSAEELRRTYYVSQGLSLHFEELRLTSGLLLAPLRVSIPLGARLRALRPALRAWYWALRDLPQRLSEAWSERRARRAR